MHKKKRYTITLANDGGVSVSHTRRHSATLTHTHTNTHVSGIKAILPLLIKTGERLSRPCQYEACVAVLSQHLSSA